MRLRSIASVFFTVPVIPPCSLYPRLALSPAVDLVAYLR